MAVTLPTKMQNAGQHWMVTKQVSSRVPCPLREKIAVSSALVTKSLQCPLHWGGPIMLSSQKERPIETRNKKNTIGREKFGPHGQIEWRSEDVFKQKRRGCGELPPTSLFFETRSTDKGTSGQTRVWTAVLTLREHTGHQRRNLFKITKSISGDWSYPRVV